MHMHTHMCAQALVRECTSQYPHKPMQSEMNGWSTAEIEICIQHNQRGTCFTHTAHTHIMKHNPRRVRKRYPRTAHSKHTQSAELAHVCT